MRTDNRSIEIFFIETGGRPRTVGADYLDWVLTGDAFATSQSSGETHEGLVRFSIGIRQCEHWPGSVVTTQLSGFFEQAELSTINAATKQS